MYFAQDDERLNLIGRFFIFFLIKTKIGQKMKFVQNDDQFNPNGPIF